MKNIFFITTIFVLCHVFSISSSSAQVYLEKIEIAPSKVYKSALENFEKKKYEEVDLAIYYIEPVMDAIKSEFGIDLKPEIQSGLKAKGTSFCTAIRRLIFYDICLIFTSIDKEGKDYSTDKLRVWFKMAYINYLLLSPVLLKDKANFAIDRKIKKMFSESYLCFGSESPYGKKIPPNLKLFRKRSVRIIEELIGVFPEFKEEVESKK
ncbi:hypothetical protein KKG56_04030 [bacterium]|nr:hypothetical protein [bacterium]